MHLKPEPSLSLQEYDALSRIDLHTFLQRVFVELAGKPFLDNWHVHRLCGEVDRIRTTANTRLAIALPPRSLKSIIVSVALPAWLLGHSPAIKIVCASYGQDLADQLSADCRRVMLAPWYRRLFPATQLDRQALGNLVTTDGGARFATSVGGTLTGMGADVIIVDDPMKPGEALSDTERAKINGWASDTLFTRINQKSDDRIIIVQQRLHEDDMIGHVMEVGGFELLSFPAIAQEDEEHVIRTPFGTYTHRRKTGEALHPERESIEVLEKQRMLMGTDVFAAQYLQSPTPPGGGIVKTHWFNRYDLSQRPQFFRIVQSWDCAAKASQVADYSVCTTWGVTHAKDIYLLHILRDRLEYPELKRKVREMAGQHGATVVLIEDTSAGIQLIQELRLQAFAHIEAIKVQGDKGMRMRAQTPTIEAGKVWIPKQAVWLADYLHELAMFPKGKFDDQVDSTSQALGYIRKPDAAGGLADALDVQLLRQCGLTPEDLTVTFDYNDPFTGPAPRITSNRGRRIARGQDGFFHCSEDEWGDLSFQLGMVLIRNTNRRG